MENLTVDRESGLYHFTEKGREYAFTSVTHIIKHILWENPWASDEALERGRLVHAASYLLDGGKDGGGLAWSTLDPSLVGPTRAYERFKDTEGFIPMVNEENVRSLKYRFAGRPDKLGYFLFNKKLRNNMWMVDLKVGKPEAWTGVQLAAYRVAYKEMHPRTKLERIRRMAVELRDDGDYRMYPMENPADLSTFLCAMGVYHWLATFYPGRRRVQ